MRTTCKMLGASDKTSESQTIEHGAPPDHAKLSGAVD